MLGFQIPTEVFEAKMTLNDALAQEPCECGRPLCFTSTAKAIESLIGKDLWKDIIDDLAIVFAWTQKNYRGELLQMQHVDLEPFLFNIVSALRNRSFVDGAVSKVKEEIAAASCVCKEKFCRIKATDRMCSIISKKAPSLLSNFYKSLARLILAQYYYEGYAVLHAINPGRVEYIEFILSLHSAAYAAPWN